MSVDFGKTADDYAKHRTGFPEALYDRLAALGVFAPGQRVVDLGTGTGTVARSLARRGCSVTGVDLSAPLVDKARGLDAAAGVEVTYFIAPAEHTGLPDGAFDVVTAGQCWHWFDRPRAATEARRLLRPGGRIAIVHIDWIPLPGNVVELTEALIERSNPAQAKPHVLYSAQSGLYGAWLFDLKTAGFDRLETFSFDVSIPFSHEGWRGRIRSSQGIGAMLTPEAVRAFDEEHARVLADRFADPLDVPHRAFAAIGWRS